MKPRPSPFQCVGLRRGIPLCAANTLTLLAVPFASGITVYFDTNGITGGSGNANGNWDAVTANWSTNSAGTIATAAWAAGNTAQFSAGTDFTGTRIVTVSGTQSLAGIII